MIIPGTEAGLSVHLTGMFDTRKEKLQASLNMFSAATSEQATVPILHNGFLERKNITRHEIINDNDVVGP
jgi:hypothetical protein